MPGDMLQPIPPAKQLLRTHRLGYTLIVSTNPVRLTGVERRSCRI
jgi:hypothetical protein